MNFSVYQQEALKTALYPNVGSNILYPMLGLMGEAGEVSGKLSKVIRDDNGVITPQRRDAIKSELGDILWFMATVCQEANLDMGTLYILAKAAIFNVESAGLFVLNFRLFQQVSHMSLLVERHIYVSPESTDSLEPLGTDMTMLLVNMIEICTACSLDIEQVAQANLEKLTSRQQRGVLQGDGDRR